MDFQYTDFNGADRYFLGRGAPRWREIESVLDALVPQFQPSDEARKLGQPIFDPKATNAELTAAAADRGWTAVRVPKELEMFGQGWDGGKGVVLAEWQFSNYPFLWNNIIRTEAVIQGGHHLPPLTGTAEALIVVTKSGMLPASNSTLYYEQAEAQITTTTELNVFRLPMRLVGLGIDERVEEFEGVWNTYGARYGRVAVPTPAIFGVQWVRLRGGRSRMEITRLAGG